MKALWLIPLLWLSAPGAPVAGTGEAQDGLFWLKKMANASRQLNYSGTFVYRNAYQSETSRIIHYVNPAGGEFEKLETLDGPPREIIRTNDQVTCYLPDTKTVLIERRSRQRFPVSLPAQINEIAENYTVHKSGMDRVAGHNCHLIVLQPGDKLRYGHDFCVDVGSGLPLRARTFGEKNQLLEAFAFTALKIGGRFRHEDVKSRYANRSQDWKIDRSAVAATEVQGDKGWVLTNQPRGFRKLTELKRSIAGRSSAVSHLVFSDGLAAISVFIEPLPKSRPAQSLTHQGAVNIYTRPLSDYMVTVVGEAPIETVMQIANSLEFRGAADAR